MNEDRLARYRRIGALEKPYYHWQIKQFAGYLGRRIADIGCGLGPFVDFLKDVELYLGLEPDPELASDFKRLHPENNVRLAQHGDITVSGAIAEIKANAIDTIICINTLEHIECDWFALLRMIGGVQAGGYICLLVPALHWLYGSLDKLDGHCRRYSKRDLFRLIEELPVEVVKCHYLNFLGVFGWFWKSRIIREQKSRDENYIMTNLLLPIISLERFIKPPIGLSLVMVLRKRGVE